MNHSPTLSQSTAFSNSRRPVNDSSEDSDDSFDGPSDYITPSNSLASGFIDIHPSNSSYTDKTKPRKSSTSQVGSSTHKYSNMESNSEELPSSITNKRAESQLFIKRPLNSQVQTKIAVKTRDGIVTAKKVHSKTSPNFISNNDEESLFDPEISNLYKFILLKNLNENVTASHIYNLFQCYGKVSTIYYKKTEQYALVEFENSRQAAVSKSALHEQSFFESKLEILILSQGHFDILSAEEGFTIYRCKQEIFHSKTKNSFVNFPSDTIYISNLRDVISNYEFMVGAFGVFGNIQSLKFKYNSKDKNSCFLKFSNISESISAISHMNMRDICGRKLNVSFTKTIIE